ncbi:uncharacterized protein LOC107625862 isoform X2 [Arachis ipaensis]|uniref:uncharacterized protein LOC107625862 isoform X2 n=1 Tax=Arachis ipaensis TaxID=130454 RepID=UPI000A2B0B6C|nr:uncharacterized protein LOC107625862 isoform X2 [Arachis ipaensis]XP_025633963.1 uncharacterized protein LOC112728148 [Arachis hypogaea]
MQRRSHHCLTFVVILARKHVAAAVRPSSLSRRRRCWSALEPPSSLLKPRRERRGERRVTPSVVAAFLPPSPKLLGLPSMHPCCCCVAGASRRCIGRRRTQIRPLSSWVLIVANYSIVRHFRNQARFTDAQVPDSLLCCPIILFSIAAVSYSNLDILTAVILL